MDTYSLYKDLYFHEMERRDQLNRSLSFPAGLMAVLFGAAIVMYKSATFRVATADKILLAFLCVVAISLVATAYFLIRTYWGHTYSAMPFAEDLHTYQVELCEYYKSANASDDAAEVSAQSKLATYVELEFSKNAKINAVVNDAKSVFLFKANAFLISSIVFLGITSPFYLYVTSRQQDNVQKIQIVQGDHIMTQQEQPPKPPPPAQPPPSHKPEPTPPPSRLIREHTEKPLRK
ncbi:MULTISPECIES: hypothetical protein [unclassified Thiomonas]|jgi:hypothetical protein|uniref:hypothetical protein n=1 Tax=unclassified Thiomonas TaxID=2625466 RepID=UPI000BD83865|nr:MULTISPECIES: hypothetical protein [unclassified Thiomonas]OZB69432.1 MAG: hypothetical protein B7X30_12940 [Thiomonas sp. 13-64-67]